MGMLVGFTSRIPSFCGCKGLSSEQVKVIMQQLQLISSPHGPCNNGFLTAVHLREQSLPQALWDGVWRGKGGHHWEGHSIPGPGEGTVVCEVFVWLRWPKYMLANGA